METKDDVKDNFASIANNEAKISLNTDCVSTQISEKY
jgi:hypothetical protein